MLHGCNQIIYLSHWERLSPPPLDIFYLGVWKKLWSYYWILKLTSDEILIQHEAIIWYFTIQIKNNHLPLFYSNGQIMKLILRDLSHVCTPLIWIINKARVTRAGQRTRQIWYHNPRVRPRQINMCMTCVKCVSVTLKCHKKCVTKTPTRTQPTTTKINNIMQISKKKFWQLAVFIDYVRAKASCYGSAQ